MYFIRIGIEIDWLIDWLKVDWRLRDFECDYYVLFTFQLLSFNFFWMWPVVVVSGGLVKCYWKEGQSLDITFSYLKTDSRSGERMIVRIPISKNIV